MKRSRVALVGVLLLPILGGTVAGASSSPRDFVVIGGQHLAFGTGPGVVVTGVSAHSGPVGENPRGSFVWTIKGEGQQPFKATVTCLLVSGNEAFATGVIRRPASAAGQHVVLHAVDNGNPSSSETDLIRFSFAGAIVEVVPGCFLPLLPPVEVTRGNILVRDALP